MARESLHIDWDDSAMHTFSTSQMMQQFREQAKSPGTSVRRSAEKIFDALRARGIVVSERLGWFGDRVPPWAPYAR